MTLELRLWTFAVLCLGAFLALGFAASHGPPWQIDLQGAALRGQATPLALIFTATGRALPLLALAVAGIAAAAIAHVNVRVASLIFIAQLLSQGAVEFLKFVFRRIRPDAWIVHRELGYSYPSGHATTAIVFFGSWLVFLLCLPLPRPLKIGIASLLAIWMLGIDWSRVALGAHYPTDVLGGTLFGMACACALWAMLLHFRLIEPMSFV
jgi:undecaprenyl-diphosphatase